MQLVFGQRAGPEAQPSRRLYIEVMARCVREGGRDVCMMDGGRGLYIEVMARCVHVVCVREGGMCAWDVCMMEGGRGLYIEVMARCV